MKKVTVQLTVAEKEQEGGNESDTNTDKKDSKLLLERKMAVMNGK